jgi:hypothetical protein
MMIKLINIIMKVIKKFIHRQTSNSQLGAVLSTREHLPVSRDVLGCQHLRGNIYWHLVGRGRDIPKYPKTYRTAPKQRSISPNVTSANAEKQYNYRCSFLGNNSHLLVVWRLTDLPPLQYENYNLPETCKTFYSLLSSFWLLSSLE